MQCPKPNCEGVASLQEGDPHFECPQCGYEWCRECQRNWHPATRQAFPFRVVIFAFRQHSHIAHYPRDWHPSCKTGCCVTKLQPLSALLPVDNLTLPFAHPTATWPISHHHSFLPALALGVCLATTTIAH